MPSFPVTHVFAGGTVRLGPDGPESGIVKRPVTGRIAIELQGLAGDVQCDRRVHGGPDKAVHQFAESNYRRLAAQAPECEHIMQAGSIGENLLATGMDETDVHIGDVFRVGTALLEVSQPRTPCGKIDRRYGVDGLAKFIADQSIAGWYYQVVQPGMLAAGDVITLADRPNETLTIARFWAVQSAHRPDLAELRQLADARGLAASWKQRLEQRLAWLREHQPPNGY